MRQSENTEKLGETIRDPGPLPPIGSLLQIRALELGRQQVEAGVRESPPYSNSGPPLFDRTGKQISPGIDGFLLGHDMGGDWLVEYPPRKKPWCCRAMVWLFIEAAIQLELDDPFHGAANGGGLASGYKLLRDYARPRKLVRTICRPGLVGVILKEDLSSHVVACWNILEGGRFLSLEGNSRDVFRFTPRAISEVTHWVEIAEGF